MPAGSGPSTCATVVGPCGFVAGVCGGREPVRWWVWSVAHYWVLRQQAPSPLVGVGVLCLGSRRPAGGRVPFGGCCHQCAGCAGCCLRTV